MRPARTTALFILGFSLYQSSFSQTFDQPLQLTNTVLDPEDIHLADMDGDGDMDLVYFGDYAIDENIGWSENLGGGTFAKNDWLYSGLDAPRVMGLADFNADGYPDVVAWNLNNKQLTINHSNGPASLDAHLVIFDDNAYYVNNIYPEDVDNDGDIDILFSSFNSGYLALSWLENNGFGLFAGPFLISDSGHQDSNADYAVDFDNDGDVDIVSVDFGTIAYHENLGGGNFSASQEFLAPEFGFDFPINHTSWGLHLVDLDVDGDVDLISYGNGEMVYFERVPSSSSNLFEAEVAITDEPLKELTTMDMDGDGDLDIVGIGTSDELKFYRNNGSLPFDSDLHFSEENETAVYEVQEFRLEDIDADGDIDIVLCNAETRTLTWLENDGMATFDEISFFTHEAYGVYDSEAADVDMDGDLDVLAVVHETDEILLYRNDGTGQFAVPEQVNINQWGFEMAMDGVNDLVAEDLDGDGDVDVACVTEDTDGLHWFANDGSGAYVFVETISTFLENPRHMTAADLHADGDMDLFISENNGEVVVYENDGSGDFSGDVLWEYDNFGPQSIAVDDLDLDGHLDILMGTAVDDAVSWNQGDGAGNFAPRQVITSGVDHPAMIKTCDLNGDDIPDVLVSYKHGDEVSWIPNNGDGTFATPQVLASSFNRPEDVDCGDFDHDGDLDVVASATFDDDVVWFENDGTGSFGPLQYIEDSANGARDVTVADLDGDGVHDLISSKVYPREILWYPSSASATCLGDFNNDGVRDISDFLDFNTNFGINCMSCVYDMNGDDLVDIQDFLDFNSLFGQPCP